MDKWHLTSYTPDFVCYVKQHLIHENVFYIRICHFYLENRFICLRLFLYINIL